MREKLIELSEQLRYCAIISYCPNCKRWDEVCELQCVDFLLLEAAELLESVANGVVVSKMETTTDKDTNVPGKVVPHKVDTDHVHVGSGIWRKGTTVYKCPKCQTFVMRYCKFCFECGQALEWQTEPPKGE